MSFLRRRIDVTFNLTEGSFTGGSSDAVKVTGLRVNAAIENAGAGAMASANLRIFGMKLDLINQLSTYGRVIQAGPLNRVLVEAGDDDVGMPVVFQGSIQAAYGDLNGAPDGAFVVQAFSGLQESVAAAAPLSLRGPVDVASAMSSLATQMGMAFQNYGVETKLPTTYLPGTPRDQVVALAEHANISHTIENNALIIWPAGAQRGDQIPLVSAETGMIGYPMYTDTGIQVSTLYNPNISFGVNVQVESVLKAASGRFNVYGVAHDLVSEDPGGAWDTHFRGSLWGHDIPAV